MAYSEFIYFNIVDLCGILSYKRMYPHKCSIKINFDILTTQKYQLCLCIIAIYSSKVNIEAFKLNKGQRHFSSSRIHVHEHFQH